MLPADWKRPSDAESVLLVARLRHALAAERHHPGFGEERLATAVPWANDLAADDRWKMVRDLLGIADIQHRNGWQLDIGDIVESWRELAYVNARSRPYEERGGLNPQWEHILRFGEGGEEL